MNNKIILFIILCLAGLSVQADSVDQFMMQQKRILAKQAQENKAYEEQLQQRKQKLQAQLQQSKQVKESQKIKNKIPMVPKIPIAPRVSHKTYQSNTSSKKTCNCNDPKSQYNYPDNYLYNKQHQRIYQLHPYCKCEQSIAQPIVMPTTPAVSTHTSSSNKKSSKQQKSNSYWNIHY